MLLNRNIAEPAGRLSRKRLRDIELGYDPDRVTRLADCNDLRARGIGMPHLRYLHIMGYFTEPGLVRLEQLFKKGGCLKFYVIYNVAKWNWRETRGAENNNVSDDVLLENIFDV